MGYYDCSFAFTQVSAEVGVGNNVRHIERKKIEEGTGPHKKIQKVAILDIWSGQNLAVDKI